MGYKSGTSSSVFRYSGNKSALAAIVTVWINTVFISHGFAKYNLCNPTFVLKEFDILKFLVKYCLNEIEPLSHAAETSRKYFPFIPQCLLLQAFFVIHGIFKISSIQI